MAAAEAHDPVREEEEEDDDDDWEGWAEPEVAPTRDLFSARVFESAADCLAHAAKDHGLDLSAIATRLRLDVYGRVKLVNYVRKGLSESSESSSFVQSINEAARCESKQWPWKDDQYLIPVVSDDPLLYSLGAPFDGEEEADESSKPDGAGTEDAGQAGLLLETIQQMREEMVSMLGLSEDAVEGQAAPGGIAISQPSGATADATGSTAGKDSSASSSGAQGAEAGATEGQYGSTEGEQSAYFASYAKLGIHEDMLGDHVRTQGYKDAIEGLGPLIEGKAALDVGCGTAILSMIAAKAGAARVIGVDASEIVEYARRIVNANGLDGKVTLMRGTMERLALPDGFQADVIISEWMGYALLYESMLPTVLYARDRYLKPGGLLLPSSCEMLITPSSHSRLRFWDDVYGFSMGPIAETLIKEASVEHVPADGLLSNACQFKTIDVTTITDAELDFVAPFRMEISKEGTLRSFVVHFDTVFDCTPAGGKRTVFTTSCEATATHWKQTALYLKTPLEVCKGTIITGRAHFARGVEYKRAYNMVLDVEVDGIHKATQCWQME